MLIGENSIDSLLFYGVAKIFVNLKVIDNYNHHSAYRNVKISQERSESTQSQKFKGKSFKKIDKNRNAKTPPRAKRAHLISII